MNRFTNRTSARQRPQRRAGFTLLEILVAVAAVAIIATGLAAIFDSVGKTVTSGRRVSRINQYGRLLEQQLRNDFTKMTRDGFLVIRQQFADANGTNDFESPTGANPGDAVALYEDQPRVNTDRPADQWRPRRVDEILFFKRGDAASSRVSIGQAGWEQPSSKESMIYYGHGMRMKPDADEVDSNASPYTNPKVNETNSIARNASTPTAKHLLGYREDPNEPDQESNPNVYASKWILLRKQTVLIPPSVTKKNPPAAFGFPYIAPPNDPDVHLRDYDCQVGGQPAAPSVFRSLNRLYTPNFDTTIPGSYATLDTHLWYSPSAAGNYVTDTGGPLLSSGVVDIATTSLAEIQSMVMGYAHTDPNSPGAPPFARIPGAFTLGNGRSNANINNPSGVFVPSIAEFSPTLSVPLPYRITNPADWTTPTARPGIADWEAVDYMHAWMDNAFPTRASAHGGPSNYPTDSDAFDTDLEYANEDRGVRIRCEEFAPELLKKLVPAPGLSADAQRYAFYEQADLAALSASNLVVGCSEFTVDWTLGGVVADPGQVVWYGPQTPCGFFQFNTNCGPRISSTVYVTDDTTNPSSSPTSVRGGRAAYPYTERLIYGYDAESYRNTAGNDYPLSVSSFFGYIDPTYTRDVDRDGIIEPGEISDEPMVWDDLNGNNLVDPGEMANNPSPSSRRWIWPTMIRVRVTIADPVDPSIESTFEYVFDVPDDRAR